MKFKNLLKKTNICKLKYLSPDGQSRIPDMVYVAKGMWLDAARENEEKFTDHLQENAKVYSLSGDLLKEGISPEQGELSKYKGGIIIFSTDVNSAQISVTEIITWFKQNNATFVDRLMKNKSILYKLRKERPPDQRPDLGFSIGTFFKGHYPDIKSGRTFNEKSVCIEMTGIPAGVLQSVSAAICRDFEQPTVLVKDFSRDRFYLVDVK
jgi:hypothetical protein